jgi:hypothetical protein
MNRLAVADLRVVDPVDRRSAGRGRAAAGADVGGALAGVVGGGGQSRVDLAAGGCGVEEAPQEGAAPAAAGPRAEALAELPDSPRLFHAEVVDHLPLGDVEAETEFFVEFHIGFVV